MECVLNIDEGDHLPGNVGKITTFLEKLNTWYPVEINKQWINATGPFIAKPNGFNEIIKKLHQTDNFKNISTLEDAGAI